GPVLRPAARTRAVEALTDLVLRGYPAPSAARMIGDAAAREPAALERLSGQLERARLDAGLTHVEAIDAVARATAQGASVERALQGLRRGADDDQRGPNRDSSGARGPHGNNGQGPHK